jgi:MoxR-like ATPase
MTIDGVQNWQFVPRARDEELELPEPFFNRNRSPLGYDPGPALEAAVNIALLLGQPLLLTGEPGCGKTSLAYWLAFQLGLPDPLVQVVKSTTTGRDLLYRFDELARFRDANDRDEARQPLQNYLEFEALGRAILFSAGPDQPLTFDRERPWDDGRGQAAPKIYSDLHSGSFPSQRRQVVLIDELDKAPRDTPNDLLSEIERMEFRITELGAVIRGDPRHRPVVVITSNSDKSLPEPFLRRCVYHHIPSPNANRRKEIVDLRRPRLIEREILFASAMQVFEQLRDRIGVRGRPPGTAELLAWLDVVDSLYPAEMSDLHQSPEGLKASLGALGKTKDDLTLMYEILQLPS